MSHLTLEQTEQLKEIGAYLRQLRQDQAISTEEVAAKTFIPSRLLSALEEGQPEQLPEPVFIQGFIRRYADVLNLDGSTLAQQFPANSIPIRMETRSVETPQALSISLKPYVPHILFVAVVVSAASGLLYLVNKSATEQTQLQQKDASVVQPQNAVPNPVASTPAPPKTPASGAPIQFTVELKEPSWLRVIVDGKPEFEGILTQGKKQTWTAQETLTIRAGNSGAVRYYFNQQEPKLLGKIGEVEELTFTPQGVAR